MLNSALENHVADIRRVFFRAVKISGLLKTLKIYRKYQRKCQEDGKNAENAIFSVKCARKFLL